MSLSSIGLSETDVTIIEENDEQKQEMLKLIEETSCDSSVGAVVYALCLAVIKGQTGDHRDTLAALVKDRKVTQIKQLKAGLQYIKKSKSFSLEELSSECGVGVQVTPQQLKEQVQQAVQKEAKSWKDMGKLLGKLTRGPVLKWADGAEVKKAVEEELTQLFGAQPEKQGKKKKGKKSGGKKEDNVEEVKVVAKPDTPFKAARVLGVPVGERVRLRGWIHQLRRQKKTLFVVLRDAGSGYLQCVLSGDVARTQQALDLRLEASVELYGVVGEVPEGATAEGGVELQVDYMEVVGAVDSDITAIVNQSSGEDLKVQQRHVLLRGRRNAAYLRLRSLTMHCMRQHFYESQYYEVTPSTIVQTSCEGGSDLFAFDYFGEEAYLTQSSQLYLETALPAVGKTFCILPSFRAEKSRTRRHLAEYTHLEAELPWISFEDLIEAIESLIVDTLDRILALPEAATLLREVNPDFKPLKRPFRRMSYTEAVDFCREHKITKLDDTGKPTDELYEHGEDLPESAERQILAILDEPIFLYRFPVPLKAFYMSKTKDDPSLTESVDLLLPGVGEVVGGSMRIHDYDELMAAYKREGLDAEPYYWYTDQRKFGTTPHGGYGLGVERFLTFLFDDDHIKHVCMFPRYRGVAKP